MPPDGIPGDPPRDSTTPKPPPLSYAETVEGVAPPPRVMQKQPTRPTLGGFTLPPRPVSQVEDIPAILFTAREIDVAVKQLEFTMVMKFSAGRPHLRIIQEHIAKEWKLKGTFIVGLMDPRHVMVYLTWGEDLNCALSKESHMINNCMYRSFRWSPYFTFRFDCPLVAVWIRLHKLPLHYFAPAILERIGNGLGHYLRDGKRKEVWVRIPNEQLRGQTSKENRAINPYSGGVKGGTVVADGGNETTAGAITGGELGSGLHAVQEVVSRVDPVINTESSILIDQTVRAEIPADEDFFNSQISNQNRIEDLAMGEYQGEIEGVAAKSTASQCNEGVAEGNEISSTLVGQIVSANVEQSVHDQVNDTVIILEGGEETNNSHQSLIGGNSLPCVVGHTSHVPIETFFDGELENEFIITHEDNSHATTVTAGGLEDSDIVQVNTGNEILAVSAALGAQWGVLDTQNESVAPDMDREAKINMIREKVKQAQASSAPNLRPPESRRLNPKYFNNSYQTNLSVTIPSREKCPSDPEGYHSDASMSAYAEARQYGGTVRGVNVSPGAPIADGRNFDEYYNEDDGFIPVKKRHGKSTVKFKGRGSKRYWGGFKRH